MTRRRRTVTPDPPSRPTHLLRSTVMTRLWPAGITALSVITPLIPSESDAHRGTSNVMSVVWLLGLLAWACGAWIQRGTILRWGRREWLWPALLSLVALSTWWACHTGNPRLALNGWARWSLLLAIPFLCRQILDRPVYRRCLVWVMICLATVLSAHGYHQILYGMPKMRAAYEADPEGTLAQAGIDAPPGSPLRYQFENRLRSPEPLATFALTNSFAGFVLPWLAIVAGLLGDQVRAERPSRFALWLAVILFLLVGCFWWTHSRSAHTAFVLGVAWLLWRQAQRHHRTRLAILAGTTIVLLVMAARADLLPAGPLQAAWQSLKYRFEYWQATAALVACYPWLGCGPGQFQDTYTQFKLPQASETIADPHNFVLEVVAVLGLPAALLFGLLLASPWWRRWGSAAQPVVESAEDESAMLKGRGETSALPDGRSGGRPFENPGVARPSVSDDEKVTVGWMLAGAATGLLVAFPLGAVVGFPPDSVLLWLGGPLACGGIAQGYQWILEGRLPRSLVHASFVMMLVHLLAAGGISFAGVAVNLWILWSLIDVETADPSNAENTVRSPTARSLFLVAVSVLFFSVVTGAYWPTIASRRWISEGDLWWERATRRDAGAGRAVAEAAAGLRARRGSRPIIARTVLAPDGLVPPAVDRTE